VGYAYVCHGSINRYWLRSIVGVVLTYSDTVHGDRIVVCLASSRTANSMARVNCIETS
jgi:hypothetical protein